MTEPDNGPIMRDPLDPHIDPETEEGWAAPAPAPAAWRFAKALVALRGQIDAAFPDRDQASDGTVGDAAHRSRSSDHNPWIVDGGVGVVSATDITDDPKSGCDAEKIVAALHASRDDRIKYLIWNRRIANSAPVRPHAPWAWRHYGGRNRHAHHFHLSVKSDKSSYDDVSPWTIDSISTILEAAMSDVEAIATEPEGVKAEAPGGYGTFDGLPVRIELALEDRSATLLDPICYTTEAGVAWPVPAGAWLDGASIPRAFWSIIGGPYEGAYREPSIVHDHYCIVRTRAWRATHRMFHEAMRFRGVPTLKAKLMFYAVYRFGPRWAPGDVQAEMPALVGAEPALEEQAESIVADAREIRYADLDLDAIEALADSRRASNSAAEPE